MSRGPGRIERAIRALFDAHPDEAFVTDALAAHCYPGVAIERKHQVAARRAACRVAEEHPDWAWCVAESHGGSLVFFNQASVPSRAMAHVMSGCGVAYHSKKRADRVRRAQGDYAMMTEVLERDDVVTRMQRWLGDRGWLAFWQQQVRWHIAERDGTAETVAQVQFERVQEQEQRHATITGLVYMTKRAQLIHAAAKLGLVHLVLLDDSIGSSGNTYDLAALAARLRALMVENDPDAVRAGLAEIADALECLSQPVG